MKKKTEMLEVEEKEVFTCDVCSAEIEKAGLCKECAKKYMTKKELKERFHMIVLSCHAIDRLEEIEDLIPLKKKLEFIKAWDAAGGVPPEKKKSGKYYAVEDEKDE